MANFKKFGASLLTVFTFITQISPVMDVFAASETPDSDEHVKVAAENEQSDNIDPETLTDEDEAKAVNEAVAAYSASDPSTGVTSVTFSAELFQGAVKEGDRYVWHAKSNATGHGVGYRVNYSTSGIADIPAGSLQIDVPVHIIKDRNGEYADTYDMSLPSEEEFEETHRNDPDTVFAYRELDRDGDGSADTVRVFNKIECPAGQNGYFEIAYYNSKTVTDYKDMSATDPFKAVMSIGTGTWKSDEIPFYIDSNATIQSTSAKQPTRYGSWPDSWGSTIKPDDSDSDKYLYLAYEIRSEIATDISQPYTFSIDADVTSKTGDVEVVGYRFSGGGCQTENAVGGQTLDDARWDYVLVRYNKKTFMDAGSYKINATFTATVTPEDVIDSATSKKTAASYSWVKPVFTAPASTYAVFEHGNGTWESDDSMRYYKDRQANDRHSSAGRDYERYDLDDLQDGTVSNLDSIRFISHAEIYNGAWTAEDGSDKSDPDSYYRKKVTSTMESGEVYIEDFADDVTPGNDYRFNSSPLTADDYNIDYFTYKVTNEYRTVDEDLKFTNLLNQKYDDETVYTFYAKYGGSDSWVKAGTYKPSTSEVVVVDSSHIEKITPNKVEFKKGSNASAYKIETANASYETKIYAEAFFNLKNSTNVLNAVKGKTLAYMANTVRFYAYDYKGNQVGSDRNWDFNRLIRSQKDSEIIKKPVSGTNNRKKKQYAVTWKISMGEFITTGAGGGVRKPIAQNGGTFYDLLPEGAVLNENSVYLTDTNGQEISSSNYTVTTENNYRNSNRTLVKVDVNAGANAYILYYDTVHSWNAIKDYGSNVVNPVAFETKNEKITNGYYDDPSKPSEENGSPAFTDSKLLKIFKNLDTEKTADKARFIYHQGDFNILAVTAGTAGLSKKVLGDNSSNYSASAQTHTGGEYSYNIRYQNTFTTRATNLIFYDSLENYTTPEGKSSDWHGTLSGLGLNQLTEKGVAPAVYISTVENLDLNANHDLSDTSVWTKVDADSDLSKAKAVAIDARYTADGSNFVLEKGESLTAYLYMKAPEYDVVKMESGYPYAYNNVYASSTLTDGLNSTDYFVHQDYTSIYYLVAGDLRIRKINVNNPDETISGIKYRLFGTSGYGNRIDMILSTAADGTILFKGVEKGKYILQEYDSGDDWLMDPTEYNVTIDENGNTIAENGDYSTGALTLTDAPRVHADIRFSKKNLVTQKNISGAKFLLKGTSDYGTAITKFAASSNATGLVSFLNIEKGTYELTEVDTADGYTLNDNRYRAVVDDSGNVTVSLAEGDADFIRAEAGKTAIIYNEPLHNVTVLKQNNYDYGAVEGVTFKLSGTSDNGAAVDQNQTTGTSGMATFTGIESGTYTITEVAVEDHTDGINVELDTTPKVITVDKFGNSTIEGTNKDSQGNTIIVDNAKADKTITVIKKFNDDGTVDHSKDLPTIHASTNDPTKPSSAESNESAINEASLDDVQDDKSVVDSVVDGVKNVGKAIKNLFITEAHAEETYTVTYDAGDGQFEDGSKTNTVTYTVKSDPVVKYSHTDNVDDTGKQNGNYRANEKKTEVVTISGADQLTVTVTYGGESANYDYVSIFSGSHPNYTASSDYSKADIEQKLGGGNHSSQTKTYTVQGDSVTFAWKSDSSGCGDGYGYYATVTYSGKTMSGSYKRPTAPKGKKIEGWAAAKNGAVVYPKTGIPDTEKITSNMTLYAVYSDFQWYDDWEYSLDESNRTILLKKYNGDETTYKIPAKATIEGTNYTTVIGSTDNSIIKLNTGVISNLSFQNGVQTNESFFRLFYGNGTIQSIDFNGVDTSKVTDMRYMFQNCSSLTSLDVSNFDTSKVTDMSMMFCGCKSLTSLNLSNFDTSKVTDMGSMFSGCSGLTSLNMSHFNTSQVANMGGMFHSCSGLTSLDVSHFDTFKATIMNGMFYECSSLPSLDVSHFDTSKVTGMNGMFYNCSKLTSLDVSHFDTSKVTNMMNMFSDCKNLISLDVSHFDTSKVTDMSQMFNGCGSLTSLDVSHFDTSKVIDMGSMFSSCGKLTSLYVSNFDTSQTTNMNSMFYSCSSLISLDVSGFDTSKVTRMRSMFFYCRSLTSLNLSNFDTSKVTDMSQMFNGCGSLTSLDVSHFDTSKVTDMRYMFNGCRNLTSLNVSNFNTFKVTNMWAMFSDCNKLTSLDVSNFDTSQVTDMTSIFQGCNSLTSLDVFADKNTFTAIKGSYRNNGVYTAVNNKLSRIRFHKGNGKGGSSKLCAFAQQNENKTVDGYTGNWTAFSEYNHTNGSELIPDTNYNGKKYSSLQNAYFSITDEQWAENPDGIWFVWEKDGQDPANQNYTSKAENFYTPAYDVNGKVKKTPEQTFTKDGYWQKIDASTYSYTFYVVDANKPFYIWEDEMAGYTSSNTAANPIRIKNGSETATITNTATTLHDLQFGSLKVTKTLVNSASTDKFSFTVTITKADGTALSGLKAFGKTAFRNGVAKFSLAGGESVDITGIPAGYHYTVAEDALSGYDAISTNAEGTITANQTVTAAFTNTAIADGPGSTGTLVIKKQVTGELPAHMDFKLNVFIYNLVPDTTYQYKYQLSDGTDETGSFTSDKQGRAVFNHYFEKDEQLEIPGLPDGSCAVVVQDAVKQSITSYTVESTTDNIGKQADRNTAENRELSTADEPIAADNTKTITFNDDVEITKDLFIGKLVDGTTTDQKFEMTVDISGLKPNSVLNTDSIGRITADADGYATKSFFLSHHESVEISGLPVGATYTVTETGTPDYQGEYEIRGKQNNEIGEMSLDDRSSGPAPFASGTGMVSKDMTTASVTIGADDYSEHSVLILNRYAKTYNLSISKTVTGNMGNRSESFDFTVKFPSTLYGHKITTTKPDGSPAYTQVSSTGVANFSLKHGETIVFSGLTADEITVLKKAVNYSVSEESYAKEGYKTTYDTAETDGSLNVYVTNFRTSGVPTGNHVGTGVAASMIIGLAALAYILAERRKH